MRQSGSRASLVTVETPEFRDFVLRTRPNSIAAKLLKDIRPAVDPTSSFRDLGSPAPGVNLIGPPDGINDIGSAVFAPLSYRNGNQFRYASIMSCFPIRTSCTETSTGVITIL